MPAQPDPGHLGTDPHLFDLQPVNFSASNFATNDLDIPLNHSPSSSSTSPPSPPNQQPIWGFTSPYGQQYSSNETLVLEGWVEDADGFADIDRIDLELAIDGDRVVDLGAVTQFVADSNNSHRATFSYQFDLSDLAIGEGNYYAIVEGIAYDRAGTGSTSETSVTLTHSHPYFDFDLDRQTYDPDDILTLVSTRVEDGDGLDDLRHIDFRLYSNSNSTEHVTVDLPDVTEFIPDYPNSSSGTFTYNLDLSTVDIPATRQYWTLEGNLVDKAGNSHLVWEDIYFNNREHLFNFWLDDPTNDTLALSYTHVEDGDGIDTLDRIDFQLVTLYDGYESRSDLPDVTEFIASSLNDSYGTFEYSLDLNTLPNGFTHHLEGTLYDRNGNSSGVLVREIFGTQQDPSYFSFNLDRNSYSASETLSIDNGIIHRSFDNTDRIDFQVIINGEHIDVADATVLIPDPEDSSSGTFEYDLDLRTLNLIPGYYDVTLQGIAYTKSGHPTYIQSESFIITHNLPENLDISLDRQSYTSNETLTITGGSVIDRDRITDIDRIDFRIQTPNGAWIDLSDTTTFNVDGNSPHTATFDYNFDLSALPLDDGIHTLQLHGSAIDRLGNINARAMREFEFVKTSSSSSSSEPYVNFDLDRWDYTLGDTLVLENAWVEDFDNIADLDRIDFVVQTDSGLAIDVADVSEFTVDPNNPNRVTFTYALDLKNLGVSPSNYSIRNFTLTGIAYDRWGQGSLERNEHFSLSNNAPDLYFSLSRDGSSVGSSNGVYGVGETITLTDAWVEDLDGLDTLDRIDFRAIVDGFAIDLPDVTEFTPEFLGSNRGRFDYHLDLWTLESHPGNYDFKLEGILYDKGGNRIGHNRAFTLNSELPFLHSYSFAEGQQSRLGQYGIEETLTLEQAKIWDFEDIADLDRIDFRARVNGYGLIDLPDVTEFTLTPYNEATFDYTLKLADYFYDYLYAYDPYNNNDVNNISLEAVLYNKAGYGYSADRNLYGNDYGTTYDFQITNSQPYSGFLSTDGGNHFTATDTVTLQDTWVEDMDGVRDIDRIEFVAMLDYGKTIELPDVTQFNIDDPHYPFRGSFEYSIDLKTLGLEIDHSTRVRLESTIFDKAGNMTVNQSQSYAEFTVSNYLPDVDFTIERSQYSTGDTLTLSQGWVEDEDGIADIDRIEVQLFSSYDNRVIDVADIENIVADPAHPHRGTFDYSLNLANLGLEGGNYDLVLSMTAYDKAGNGKRGMWQSFQLTNHIPDFSFHLPQGEYRPDDTLTLTEARVRDLDGLNDLHRVEFSLRNLSNDELIDVADATEFTADPGSLTEGTFAYSLYLGSLNLTAGNYSLEGTIFDKQGNRNFMTTPGFAIAQPLHAPQELRFSLDKSEYTARETIAIDNGWISDADGGADIARVNLRLFDAGDNFLTDLGNAANLEVATWNPLWASFNAQINLSGLNLTDGLYTISAIAYDITNRTSNVFERSFTVASPPPNFAPANLTFSLDRSAYTPTDTINLSNGWVRDENGANTLDRIDLRIVTEQGTTFDIENITSLSPASWNREWASFQFGVRLQNLNLQGGSHKLIGIAYDTGGAASQQFERGFFLEVPQSTLAPSNLNFTLNKNTYNPTDTLTIGNGWISDGDGAEDLDSVSFKLIDGNGNEINLGAIADFSIASWSPEWASFAGSFDLSQYNLTDGNYTLIGMARDRSGGESQTLSRAFTIETPQTNNTAPANLQFGLSGNTFSSRDTLEITNGWISDEDGNNDLAGVEFELVAEDGTIISLEDSFDLTAAMWDWSNQWSSFRHSIDFNVLGLTSGVYTIRGKAYDRAGDYSNTFSRSFTFV